MSAASGGVTRFGLITLLALALGALLLSSASPVWAQAVDYDTDNDGLIDVSSLAQLNALRWDMDGDGSVSPGDQVKYALAFPTPAPGMGCVATDHDSDANTDDQPTCAGYELTEDLDFDTHGNDGAVTAADVDYWDSGKGWSPIGDNSGMNPAYNTVFEGNGHTISNLFINRPATDMVGLFGATAASSKIRRIGMEGVNVTGQDYVGGVIGGGRGGITASFSTGGVNGRAYVGGLVGYTEGSGITVSYSNAVVSAADDNVGGLVGYTMASASVVASYATGAVTGDEAVGGLVGSRNNTSKIIASYATGAVTATSDVGGLVGAGGGVTNSYWDVTTSGIPDDSDAATGVGKTTAELQTPTAYGSGAAIYAAWNVDVDNADRDDTVTTNVDDPWDFGTASEYPALKADFDGDGTPTAYEFGRQGRSAPVLNVDYDADNDGLIEVSSLAQLNALRWDLDGNGASTNVNYAAAFPTPATGMGCPITTTDVDDNDCTGYELTADLDFDTHGNDGAVTAADVGYWDSGKGWSPIGSNSSQTTRYAAVFEGNGHTISNLFINRPSSNDVGLFGAIRVTSEVRRVGLDGVNVTGQYYTSSLVGSAYGSIRSSYSNGSVAGQAYVGGLAGYISGGGIGVSYSNAAVTASAKPAGGLAGYNNNNSTITASYATGAVTATRDVGGLVGENAGTIIASYATGAVDGTTNVGGLVGVSAGTGTITDSYWDVTTSGIADDSDAATGVGKTTSELQSPTVYGSGAAIYAAWNVDVDNTDNDNDLTTNVDDPWDFGTGSQYPALKADFDGDGSPSSGEFGQQKRSAPVLNVDYDADDNGLIEVSNLAQLNAIRWDRNGDGSVSPGDQANYDLAFPTPAPGMGCKETDHDGDANTANQPTCTGYELTADLDFDTHGNDGAVTAADVDYWDSGKGWSPIGSESAPYMAVFDGGRHTIANLFINRPTSNMVNFSDANKSNYVGLFASLMSPGEIRHLRLTGVSVTGRANVGAVVGHITMGKVSHVSSTGAVTAVGSSAGDGQKAGGLVGSTGTVAAVIEYSYSTATVTAGDDYAGGLIGESKGVIRTSYATGAVTATGDYAGGLAGSTDYGSSIMVSYATGAASGADHVGGLAGRANGDISYSYSRSASSSSSSPAGTNVGGLAGSRAGTITGSYWDVTTSGIADDSDAATGVGKTTAELQSPTVYGSGAAIYAAWNVDVDNADNDNDLTTNVDDPWDFGTGSQYPALKADFDRDGTPTWQEFGQQKRSAPVSNSAPVFTDGAAKTITVAENTAGGTDIAGSPTATDADGDTLTYTLGGTDANHFDIVAASGQLQTKEALNFEDVKNSYTVTVSVSDGKNSAGNADATIDATITVTINVTNVNEAPVFNAGLVVIHSVAENTATGQDIGAPFTAVDPDAGASVTYTLDAVDGANFDIDAATGQLQTKEALDFESKPSYSLTVTAGDGTLTATITVTINVSDVDEPPTVVPGSVVVTAAPEGLDVTWTAPTGMAGKPPVNGYDVQYKLSSASSWTDLGHSGTETNAQITGLTAGSTYDVQVRAKNAEGTGPWSATATGVPGAPAPSLVDYDADDDGLIEITTLAQLNALRWDLNGDGSAALANQANYATAFPTPAAGMGCVATDHDSDANTPNQPTCTGYELTADLDFNTDTSTDAGGAIVIDSGDDYWNGGSGWDPIGSDGSASERYNAVFEGNGYTISNLFIDRPSASDVGFFGSTGASSEVRRIGLEGVNVTGGENVGGLVGGPYGVIMYSYSTGSVAGDDSAGGLVGYISGGSDIRASYSNAVVSADDYAGGLAGFNTGRIIASYATGAVTGKEAIGGLVGDNTGGRITASYATGAVTGNTDAGGLVGTGGGVTNSYWDTATSGQGGSGGGVAKTTSDLQTPTAYGSGAAIYAAWNVDVDNADGDDTVTTNVDDPWDFGTGSQYPALKADFNRDTTRTWQEFGQQKRSAPVLNSAPTFDDGAAKTITVAENTAGGTDIAGSPTATDADGDTLTYTLGGTDANHFAIDSSTGQLQTKEALNFEGKTSYTVTVSVSDGKNSADNADATIDATITVTINVTNVNEAPVFADASTTRSVAENTAADVNIGNPIVAVDPDAGASVTYTLDAVDGANFDIDAGTGQLKTKEALDYEAKTSYSLTVTAGDGTLTDTINVTINVTNVNEAPVFADASTTRSVAENTAADVNIGNPIVAVDPDAGASVTYTLDAVDGANFDIDAGTGQLKTKEALDYEAKTSYSLTVTAGDGTLTDTITVTINVTNVNEAPVFADASTTRSVAENTATDVNIGNPIVAVDPDAGASVTYTLDAVDGANFDIDAGTGQLKTKEALDYEAKTSYSLTVTASDGTLTDTITVTINVTDVNEAPVFADASTTRSVAENTAADVNIGNPIVAVDPDAGASVTYTLDTVDGANFDIDAGTGQLKTKEALDFESKTSYSLTVTASDGTLTDTITVTINVTNVNEAPVFNAGLVVIHSVAENTATGQDIGAPFTAVDPDAGASVTYTLDAVDGANFDIDAATGQLQTKEALDFESKTSYSLTVTAGDGTLTATITVTINVTNVNEAPVFNAGLVVIHSVAENTATGQDIGAPFTAVDPDAGASVTYTLDAVDGANFDIDAATGQLKTKEALDFESKTSYSLTVTASDGTLTDTISVTVNVSDVDEPPTVAPGSVVVTAAPEALDVTWTVPTGMAGKPPVNGYDVQYKLSSASSWTDLGHSGTETNAQITGLTAGSTYDVQVRAKNAEGTGPFGADSGTPTASAPSLVDYDADDDGLIEITTLAQLNALRWDLNGDGSAALANQANYATAFPTPEAGMGCVATDHDSDANTPNQPTCTGYELTANLDFNTDTSTDAGGAIVIDSSDDYWNGGAGWEPVATWYNSIFEGNGHTISNLFINRPAADDVGLFAGTDRGSEVRRIGLEGVKVTGQDQVGGLVGTALGDIRFAYVTGSVSGRDKVGGLVGSFNSPSEVLEASYSTASVTGTGAAAGGLVGLGTDGRIRASYASGAVRGGDLVGGLVGNSSSGLTITASYATGAVSTSSSGNTGGLVAGGPVAATNSYWDIQTSGQASSATGVGKNTAELQAPTSKTEDMDGTLNGVQNIYSAWNDAEWDFGTASEYPALKVDFDRDGTPTWQEFGQQKRSAPAVGNSAPVFADGATADRSVAENTVGGQNIGGPVAATDADGDTLTYTLGGTDANHFAIDSSTGQLQTKEALDYESKPSYTVTVSVSDGKNSAGGADATADATITVTVNVTDVNEAPVFVDASAARSVAENTAADVNIGNPIVAVDPDAGASVTYTLDAVDGANFDIDASTGQLKTKEALDYEAKTSYSLTVTAGDGTLTDTITVTINVSDVAEPPTVAPGSVSATAAPGALDVTWDAPTNSDMAGKPPVNGYDVQYKLSSASGWTPHAHSGTGTNAQITGLTGGATYDVQVRAKNAEGTGPFGADSGTPTAPAPGNSAPVFTDGASATRSVAENTVAAQSIGSPIAATDGDGDALTYALGGTDANHFDIVTATGQLRTSGALNYENKISYSVTVTVSDGRGGSDSIDVTINVTDVAEAPVPANRKPAFREWPEATRWVAENTASGQNIGRPVAAVDPDGDTLTYELSGTHAAHFAIDRSTGQLKTKGALDYERVRTYDLFVLVSDRKNAAGDVEPNRLPMIDHLIGVVIYVANVDEPATANGAPTFNDGAIATRSVGENTASGVTISRRVAAVDPDGDTLTYTLSGLNASHFAIVAATGQLKTKGALDYERDSFYGVNIDVSDGKDAAGNVESNPLPDTTIRVIIDVNDVDEPPSVPTVLTVTPGVESLSVSWTAPTGAAMAGKPPVNGYDVQYKLSSASGWTSHGHSGTGTSAQITGLTAGSRYDVQVRAKNDEGDSGWTGAVSRTPTAPAPGNSAPTFSDGASATRSVAENTVAAQSIGSPVAATDADSSDTLTYSLGGTDANHFDIVTASGQLQTKSALDYEATKNSYSVTVTVTDGRSGSDSINVTINVTDVAEPPSVPTVLTVTPGVESLSVSWTAPGAAAMAGKPPVNGYDVQYKLSSDSSWTSHGHSGTGTSAQITGLTAGSLYDVQVRAKNAEGDSGWTGAVSGTPTAPAPGNRAPVFNEGASTTFAIGEGATAVGVVAASDPEGDTLTYSLDATGDHADFNIVSGTGRLTLTQAADYEDKSSYSVTVSVTDGKNAAGSADSSIDDTITVTDNVTDVNEPPSAPTRLSLTPGVESLSVSWTAPSAAAMAGKPPVNGYDVQYKLSSASGWTSHGHSGTGTSPQITGLTGGSPYDVQVRAKNAEGDSGWTGVVGVPLAAPVPANRKPAFSEWPEATRWVAENTASGQNIGRPVAAVDPDGDTLTYELSGIHAAHFAIDRSTGQLKTKGALDYERVRTYDLFVLVSDRKNAAGDVEPNRLPMIDHLIGVVIYVANVDEPATANGAPTFNDGAIATRSVGENTASGVTISRRVAAVDPDGDTLTYTLSGLNASHFAIVAATGQLKTKGALDYERDSFYGVNIDVSDGKDAAGNVESNPLPDTTIRVIIDVNDVDEPPSVPTVLTVTPGVESLSVSWTAPTGAAMAGKPPVNGYDVQYKLSSVSSWTSHGHSGTGTSAQITGLTAGLSYDVQVRAKNAEGDSGWTSAVSRTPT